MTSQLDYLKSILPPISRETTCRKLLRCYCNLICDWLKQLFHYEKFNGSNNSLKTFYMDILQKKIYMNGLKHVQQQDKTNMVLTPICRETTCRKLN
uniref:Uncharacterized protein n=1 Tax=Arundo donax TaxID=35708 RepID=A0A0A9C8X0_ARUDO